MTYCDTTCQNVNQVLLDELLGAPMLMTPEAAPEIASAAADVAGLAADGLVCVDASMLKRGAAKGIIMLNDIIHSGEPILEGEVMNAEVVEEQTLQYIGESFEKQPPPKMPEVATGSQ